MSDELNDLFSPEERTPEVPQSEHSPEAPGEEAPRRPGADLFEWLQMVMACVLAAVVLFNCFARLTRVDGSSMDNTLQDGELMWVWSLGYHPKQGDIVVLNKKTATFLRDRAIVKRVIAVGGQTVDIDYAAGAVSVDGRALEEDYILEPMTQRHWQTVTSLTVPEGCIFVLGDNRNVSNDSRNPALGAVDARYVLGRAEWVVFPLTRLGAVR